MENRLQYSNRWLFFCFCPENRRERGMESDPAEGSAADEQDFHRLRDGQQEGACRDAEFGEEKIWFGDGIQGQGSVIDAWWCVGEAFQRGRWKERPGAGVVPGSLWGDGLGESSFRRKAKRTRISPRPFCFSGGERLRVDGGDGRPSRLSRLRSAAPTWRVRGRLFLLPATTCLTGRRDRGWRRAGCRCCRWCRH